MTDTTQNASDFKDDAEYIEYLEKIILDATRKKPSTALDFLDKKADEIKIRRIRCSS